MFFFRQKKVLPQNKFFRFNNFSFLLIQRIFSFFAFSLKKFSCVAGLQSFGSHYMPVSDNLVMVSFLDNGRLPALSLC